MNEDCHPNSGIVYIEELTNSSICTESVNDRSNMGEMIFEGRTLVDNGDRAAGVQEENTMSQFSSLAPILIDEFGQIPDLHLSMHDVEKGLVVVNLREVFRKDRSGVVTRMEFLWGELVAVLSTRRGLGEDILELDVEGFVIVLGSDQMISNVGDGNLKFETVLTKFFD